MNRIIGSMGLAAALSLYGCSKPAEPTVSKPETKPAPSNIVTGPTLEERTEASIARDGIRVDIYAADDDLQSGLKLEIDQQTRTKWLPYTPVTCELPDISYSAPMPIEDGMKSVKLTLAKPTKLFGKTLYVVGRERGADVILYELALEKK